MTAKPLILVTGANGQLGMELRKLAPRHPGFEFIFSSREELKIENLSDVQNFFHLHKPAFCINAAAYTAVDKAEDEKELAYSINADAIRILAATARQYNTRLIHVSTDYVFNGKGNKPYKEDDQTDPVNAYGASKLKGEQYALESEDAIVIRTSWVYSSFGKNFVKTMLRLMKEKPELTVVADQYGSPTYAADLAEAIMHIVGFPRWQPGIFHFTNEGEISWYDFATAIKEMTGSHCVVKPVSSAQYPTAARRPAYSVLDKSKICGVYEVRLKAWQQSLALCLAELNKP